MRAAGARLAAGGALGRGATVRTSTPCPAAGIEPAGGGVPLLQRPAGVLALGARAAARFAGEGRRVAPGAQPGRPFRGIAPAFGRLPGAGPAAVTRGCAPQRHRPASRRLHAAGSSRAPTCGESGSAAIGLARGRLRVRSAVRRRSPQGAHALAMPHSGQAPRAALGDLPAMAGARHLAVRRGLPAARSLAFQARPTTRSSRRRIPNRAPADPCRTRHRPWAARSACAGDSVRRRAAASRHTGLAAVGRGRPLAAFEARPSAAPGGSAQVARPPARMSGSRDILCRISDPGERRGVLGRPDERPAPLLAVAGARMHGQYWIPLPLMRRPVRSRCARAARLGPSARPSRASSCAGASSRRGQRRMSPSTIAERSTTTRPRASRWVRKVRSCREGRRAEYRERRGLPRTPPRRPAHGQALALGARRVGGVDGTGCRCGRRRRGGGRTKRLREDGRYGTVDRLSGTVESRAGSSAPAGPGSSRSPAPMRVCVVAEKRTVGLNSSKEPTVQVESWTQRP